MKERKWKPSNEEAPVADVIGRFNGYRLKDQVKETA